MKLWLVRHARTEAAPGLCYGATDVGVPAEATHAVALRVAPGKTPLAVELKLEKRVPPEFRLHAHHWLILHGRYICVARKPKCWECAVHTFCSYKPKTPAPKQPRA